nr:venom serine carboxypeptidase-like [Leptinotarsa decemlineata]
MIKTLVVISLIHFSWAFLRPFQRKIDADLRFGDAGEPLILTPLLRRGQIEEARLAAEVHLEDLKNVTSYSGYLTVDETFNSNLFFWFFPSETDYQNDPVILWLQGGPGGSSMFGLFSENGPFFFTSKNVIDIREHRWSRRHSVLYIDNPAGTGFSFTNGGYARNQTKVGNDLFETLQQFFTLFPEIQKNDFFVTGESYGGKYVPALGYAIHHRNPEAEIKINLQGMAIGNGLSDPENQFRYADYLQQIGLIDRRTRNAMHSLEHHCSEAIRKGEYQKALDILDEDFNSNNSIFSVATGYENVYNHLNPFDTVDENSMGIFFQRADVRSAIHVGNTSFGDDKVYENLELDIVKSIVPWVSELLSHYRMLFYNGQLDIIVAYPMMVTYLEKMKFSAHEEYKKAPRHVWKVDQDLAGYVKSAGNLTEVLVRNAGHLVPADQPKWSLDMISKFVRNEYIAGPI